MEFDIIKYKCKQHNTKFAYETDWIEHTASSIGCEGDVFKNGKYSYSLSN